MTLNGWRYKACFLPLSERAARAKWIFAKSSTPFATCLVPIADGEICQVVSPIAQRSGTITTFGVRPMHGRKWRSPCGMQNLLTASPPKPDHLVNDELLGKFHFLNKLSTPMEMLDGFREVSNSRNGDFLELDE